MVVIAARRPRGRRAAVPLPRWLYLAAPVLVVTLALSYRRSLIALVPASCFVLLVASGQRGRPWLVLGAAAVGLALYVAISAGATGTTARSYRAESLSPSKLASSTGDRYRPTSSATCWPRSGPTR